MSLGNFHYPSFCRLFSWGVGKSLYSSTVPWDLFHTCTGHYRSHQPQVATEHWNMAGLRNNMFPFYSFSESKCKWSHVAPAYCSQDKWANDKEGLSAEPDISLSCCFDTWANWNFRSSDSGYLFICLIWSIADIQCCANLLYSKVTQFYTYRHYFF